MRILESCKVESGTQALHKAAANRLTYWSIVPVYCLINQLAEGSYGLIMVPFLILVSTPLSVSNTYVTSVVKHQFRVYRNGDLVPSRMGQALPLSHPSYGPEET